MTSLTSLSTLQQSYQDANPLVCPGLFFSSAIAENARLEPPRLRQESSTAMFFTPTNLSNGHTTATESAFLLVVVQNSTSLLPGSCWPYGDISPMIFTDSSFTGLEMRSKKALR